MGVSKTNYALDSQSVLVAKFMELRCIFKVLHLVQMMHLFVIWGQEFARRSHLRGSAFSWVSPLQTCKNTNMNSKTYFTICTKTVKISVKTPEIRIKTPNVSVNTPKISTGSS